MNCIALTRVVCVGLAVIALVYVYHRLLKAVFKPGRRLVSRQLLGTVSVVLALGTVLGLLNLYVYHGFGVQPDIYRRGDRITPMVSLTFDDGPSAEFTPMILDILKEYNVCATFFVVGSHVEKYPEIAQRIVEEGHEIGNHTNTHRNIPTLSMMALQEEVIEATSKITSITGRYPEYIRPPRGMYDGRFGRLAEVMGHKIVLWTISSRDWRYGTTADAIVRSVVPKVRGGDIILFHDSGAMVRHEGGDRMATVKALPKVIEGITNRGLSIVPLRVLLMNEEPEEGRLPSTDLQE